MADYRYEQAIGVVIERLIMELADWALDNGAIPHLIDLELVPDEARVEAVHRLRTQLNGDRRATHDDYGAACEYLRRAVAAS